MNNILLIVTGFVALVAGGELLVRGASKLASVMKISPLVIGLTVVAFGTSSPELAVSVQAAWVGNADIALGNVVGSNIFNVLFILGVAALIVPLVVSSDLIRRDVPLMIAASILVLLLSLDRRIGRIDGLVLLAGIVIYTVWCVRQSRRESNAALTVPPELSEATPAEQGVVGVSGSSDSDQRRLEASSVVPKGGNLAIQIALILGGLVLLGLGASWLVKGAVAVATELGISQLVIGLTVVAAGTSLPEVVTSIMAAVRGERDIAVGNVIGSNLFNLLGVLGLASAVAPDGIAVPAEALRFDFPVMIAVAVACLPIFFTGNLIERWEGGLFLACYLVYTTYLILSASHPEASRTSATGMIWFVIPLTLVTLAVVAYRSRLHKP